MTTIKIWKRTRTKNRAASVRSGNSCATFLARPRVSLIRRRQRPPLRHRLASRERGQSRGGRAPQIPFPGIREADGPEWPARGQGKIIEYIGNTQMTSRILFVSLDSKLGLLSLKVLT